MTVFTLRKLFVLSLPLLVSSVAASEEMSTVQSLDAITAQSSDIPTLLTESPVDMPAPVVSKAPVNKKKFKEISVGLNREAEAENDSLRKSLAQSQQQLQGSQSELEQKKKQLEALHRDESDNQEAASGLKKLLADSQSQTDALKKQNAALTAAQIVSSLELAQAKGIEDQTIAALKKSLDESKQQAQTLTEQVSALTAKQTDSDKALAASEAKQAEKDKALSASQEKAVSLALQVADLTAAQEKNAKSLAEAKASDSQAVTDLKQQLAENQQQRDALDKKWQEASAKVSEQETQLTTLRNQKPATPPVAEPKSPDQMRAYALGTLWGQEVAAAMEKVKADGITLDLSQVSSGVSDSIKGSFKVPQQKILEVLDALNNQVLSKKQSETKPDDFLEAYSKKPGVKRADLGYYYQIVSQGQGKIGDSDIVAISVKESLSNGKVIKDMTKTGKVLALPVANFPALFSSAIRQMNNKGKLKMAVPPELAYGEQGRPPEIPPNSTMVYEITVVDVKPVNGNK